MAPPKKKGRGGHRVDADSQPRATIGTNGKKLEHKGDAAAKSKHKRQAPDKETRAAQVADSSGAAATPLGRGVVEGDKKTGKSAANTNSTSKESKQPEQQQAKRGRGRPRKQTEPGQTRYTIILCCVVTHHGPETGVDLFRMEHPTRKHAVHKLIPTLGIVGAHVP